MVTDVRAALVDAALDELTAHGHAGISLRAVARRAGVSHAAPKNHFGDRAGLLTAVAAHGFDSLATALALVPDGDPATRLTALGQAYVDFGLTHPALFDLMFRTVELHPADPGLQRAQTAAIEPLSRAAATATASDPALLTVLAWALVHGLVVLIRDGALREAEHPGRPTGAELARRAVDAFGRLACAPADPPPAT